MVRRWIFLACTGFPQQAGHRSVYHSSGGSEKESVEREVQLVEFLSEGRPIWMWAPVAAPGKLFRKAMKGIPD